MSTNKKAVGRLVLSVNVFATAEADSSTSIEVKYTIVPSDTFRGPGGQILYSTLNRIKEFAFAELDLGCKKSKNL